MPSNRSKVWTSNLPSVRKVSSLAALLGETTDSLIELAENADRYWKPGATLKKKDGTLRPTSDARPRLKTIQQKINTRILKKIQYPQFLFGGIADPITPRSIKQNAKLHGTPVVLIKEDIENFFPTIGFELVKRVWMYFFHYSDEVATILTKLTTHRGSAPQGWKNTGYLANLVFWNREPQLVAELAVMGFTYSRWVDDICVSVKRKLTEEEKTKIISLIYGMIHAKDFKPKRTKHEILNRSNPMLVTGLLVNAQGPRLPVKTRNNLRARVHKLEKRSKQREPDQEYNKEWAKVASLTGVLEKLDGKKGRRFKNRIQKIKPKASYTTNPAAQLSSLSNEDAAPPF